MPENIQTALILLAVGMITVFVILALVVLTGKILVRVVNAIPVGEQGPVFVNKAKWSTRKRQISEAQMAAIIAAVESLTAGQGRIEKIEKISQ